VERGERGIKRKGAETIVKLFSFSRSGEYLFLATLRE
jgi:hypothetical protein